MTISSQHETFDRTPDEGRLAREKDFHNKAFSEGTRDELDKFYSVVQSSRVFYEGFLQSHCAGRNVLEYGCGPGSYSVFLAKQGANVTGIDISETAIEKAAEDAGRKGFDQVSFRLMDAEALEFEDNTFDMICGTGILHHLDLGKAFSELARTLKPEGTAIFIEPMGHNPLINLYRRITPHMRTPDEHPLLMKDLKTVGQYFGKVEARFFHLNSLMSVPFRRLPGFTLLLKALDSIDSALFRLIPPARKYAWQVVIVASQPKRAESAASAELQKYFV